jgi:hypothetical protein
MHRKFSGAGIGVLEIIKIEAGIGISRNRPPAAVARNDSPSAVAKENGDVGLVYRHLAAVTHNVEIQRHLEEHTGQVHPGGVHPGLNVAGPDVRGLRGARQQARAGHCSQHQQPEPQGAIPERKKLFHTNQGKKIDKGNAPPALRAPK